MTVGAAGGVGAESVDEPGEDPGFARGRAGERGTAEAAGGVTAAQEQSPQLARLMDAGLQLFGTAGYEATTIRALCSSARVSTRDFYRHVHDRPHLFRAVFEREVRRVLSAVTLALADLPPVVEVRTRAWLQEWMGAMVADRRRYRVLYTEAVGVSEELERHRRALLAASCELGMRQLELCAAARGERHPERHYEIPAITLFGSAREMLVRYMSGMLSTSDVDDLVDQYVRLCVLVGESW